MSSDGARNLQDERFQEAIPRTPHTPSGSEPASSNNSQSPMVIQPTGGSTIHGALTLPHRSAIEAASSSATFAKDIDVPRNVIQSSGDAFIIDVVPDTRFPAYVFTEYVQRTYSNFDFEPFSMVSPASLVGYLVYMFHAFIFLMDVFQTPQMSAYAEEVDTTHALRKLIDTVSNAIVPDIVFEVIQSIAAHRLDIRSKLEIFPSYGSVLFKYDAPRLLPPSMFLLAHNQLITQTRANSAYKHWLAHDLIAHNGTMYKVANFIGGLYQQTHSGSTHSFLYRNWLARSLFRLADSATHRTHLRRPDILDFDYSIPHVNEETYNPYVHLLMLGPAHRVTTSNFIHSLSQFCSTQLHATKSISGFTSLRLGNIVRTVIKGPTAPTWHTQSIVDVEPDDNLRTGSFSAFCQVANFALPRPDNARTFEIPVPEDENIILGSLYLVQPTEKRSELEPITADEELHNEGMNLLFDAYDDEPSAHYSTIISGKLIQNSNIDGQILPLPNPIDSLVRTNSRYLAGAVPLKHITPEFDVLPIYLYPRYPRSTRAQSMFSLLFNASQAWMPIFMQHITGPPNLTAFQANNGADGIIPTSNIVSTSDHRKVKDVGKQVLLWSSYRHRSSTERPTEDSVFYYATLELIFGTRSSLMQTYNLHQLLSLN